jgi:hypothetical protein
MVAHDTEQLFIFDIPTRTPGLVLAPESNVGKQLAQQNILDEIPQ